MKVTGDNELLVRGYPIDTLQTTGTADPSSPNPAEKLSLNSHSSAADDCLPAEALLGCINEASTFLIHTPRYPTGEEKATVFWRTLTCNRDPGPGHEAPDSYRFGFAALMLILHLAALPSHIVATPTLPLLHENVLGIGKIDHPFRNTSKDIDRYVNTFLSLMSSQCRGRRRYRTQKGYIGQIPLRARAGDVMFVVSGGRVPFLLRPRGKEYELVGQCYLDGFMRGEVLDTVGSEVSDITLV